jgi:gliding motility-associated-like protein
MIDVTPPIQVRTFPADTIGYPGDQFQLLAVPNDPDVTTYVWTPSVGLSNAGVASPTVTIGSIGADVRYKVVASTVAGCKGEAYVNVRVYKGPDIYVPTGFTPNGDGKNDRFTPFPVGMKSYNYFRIFNRWGQLVFQTRRLNDGWDGTIGGQLQPEGIYVWMIEGLTKDDRVISKKGTIMLIK